MRRLALRAQPAACSLVVFVSSVWAAGAAAQSGSGAPGHTPAARTHEASAGTSRQPSEATLPGFEMLPDGSTRFFVELTRPVAYETRTARGLLVIELKGARVDRRNNLNPLVTLHFNTPATTARLVPHGHDLRLVVSLRAPVQPTVTLEPTPTGAVLRVAFPKGDYVPTTTAPSSLSPSSMPSPVPSSSPPPPPSPSMSPPPPPDAEGTTR
jgi:hypothetical protein